MIRIIAGAAAIGVVLVGGSAIFGSFYSVDESERAIVLEWGAAKKVTTPGLHWKVPFMEGVRTISLRVDCYTGENLPAYSKDQQPAQIDIKVCYAAKPDDQSLKTIYATYRNVDGYAKAEIVPKTLEGLKTVFGQYNAVTVIQDRARFNADLDGMLADIGEGPIYIQSVQVQDIDFSDAYEQSVEARMQAQVEVEKVEQNLERERLQAEIKVVQAEAEAARVKLAGEAEAAAIEAKGQALRNNPQLVGLVAAEKWNGVLPATMLPGGAVPFVDVSANPSKQ